MKPLAFFVHSTGGSPQETFYPWLKRELEKLDFKVDAPQFPMPEYQTLDNWMDVARPFFKNFDETTIMLGRSVGCPMVLRILEAVDVKINAAFLVASFSSGPFTPDFQTVLKTFVEKPWAWAKIRGNAKRFFVYHSDNDPYLPLEKGEEVARNLKTDLTLVKGAGHFGLNGGFTQFPLLLKDVKSVL